VVLLHFGSETYFGLEAVGARVWQLAVEGQPFGQIVSTLEAEYEVSRDVLAADVNTLVRTLIDHDLVTVG
jgi:Coenzyme PQQ synthesis protein D (PqqD)